MRIPTPQQRLDLNARVMMLAALAVSLGVAGSPSVASAQTRNVSKFGEWTVYAHDDASGRICFASTPPRASDPPQDTGYKPLLYVSAWPREGVRAEVSVKTASQLKPGALSSIIVDKTTFKLSASGDRAYVVDATDELKLLDAMKKGSSVIVLAQTEQGVMAKDTYALAGLTQALQAITAACK
jgi:invasion protein IalB